MNQKENENKNEQNMVKSHEEVRKKRIWIIVAIVVLVLCFVLEKVVILILDDYFWEEPKEHVDVADSNMQNKEEKLKQDALTYLEERYDEEFVIESIRGQSYAYDYINIYTYPEKHQEDENIFKIQGRYNDEGILEFCDSYMMIKLRDDYEAYINPIIDEYFDEYKFYVTFDSEWITNNIPTDTQMEDLWKLRANEDYPLPKIYLFLGPSNDNSRIHLEKLVDRLSAMNVQCSGRVVYVEEKERYDALSLDWNNDIRTSDIDNIVTYLIYDIHEYEFTSGGN